MSTRERLALGAILLLATAVRFYDIEGSDVWVDEANLILTSQLPLREMLEKIRLDSSPPLFYVVIHFWSAAFGTSPTALRIFSALSGVALVGAIAWMGRTFLGRHAGLWAALFAALSPIQILYSQQVRMYVLLPLFALISVAGLLRTLRGEGRWGLALWVGGSLAALYTHNFAFYLAPVHGVMILLSGQLRERFGTFLVGLALVLAGYAPWVPFFLAQLENADHYAWYVFYWNRISPLDTLANVFFSYAGEYAAYRDLYTVKLLKGAPTIIAVSLAWFGALRAWDSNRGRDGPIALWPVVWLLVPALGSLGLSMVMTPHLVPGRVDQLMFPAFALLVGTGLAHLRPLPRGVLAVAMLAVGLFIRADYYADHEANPNWVGGERRLAADLADRLADGDAVLCTSLVRAPIAYYLGRLGVDTQLLSFPRSNAAHLGAHNPAPWVADPLALARERSGALAEAREMLAPGGRLYVLRVHAPINQPLLPERLPRSELRHVETFGPYRQYGTAHVLDVDVYEARVHVGPVLR